MARTLLFFFVIGVCITSHSRDLTTVDFSYLYRTNSPLEVSYVLTKKNDSETSVFLTIDQRIRGQFDLSFFTQSSFNDPSERYILKYNSDTISLRDNHFDGEYTLPTSEIEELLVVVLSRNEVDYYFPMTSNLEKIPSFLAFDEAPLTTPYLSKVPKFVRADRLYAYAYSTSFNAADPPFGIMQALSPSMDVDSLFLLSEGLNFQDWNFYFIQEDTNSSIGFGFFKTPDYFPRLKTIEELVEPMEYICSSKEYNTIVQSENIRSAFEQFWIKNVGDQQLAKKNIGRYYKRVTLANKLFSNYKPGWKTDQGMIIVVYGVPESVQRDDRKEVWTYQNGLIFEFVKISTLFAPQLYTLLRKPDYKDQWTQRIKTLRRGR